MNQQEGGGRPDTSLKVFVRSVYNNGSFSFQVGNEKRNPQKFPLNKGGKGLFENPLQSRIKKTSKRTQETWCSIRRSALESAKIQENAWLAIYETEAARKLYC